MMRALFLIPVAAVLAACVPAGPVSEKPKGPPIDIVEAARAGDTTRVVLRYKDGAAIPAADENRAVIRAMEIACQEGESAIPDTRTRADGLLTVKVFCVGVLQSDQVIDGSRLKT
ncbi:hypothetical protein BCF46_0516 [Litoreibacter meonggei]|uniref:Lipoprotein n=1 Tax=Litoreibacter meonggei TaxID=1049199 RepID=A0A497X4X5_9RHOB|nr:hypothetical protein [Litoreibacter meonggei]RLJ60318.1 hypothetical protein BCF46_0516 [Litoreibacter meonggei]